MGAIKARQAKLTVFSADDVKVDTTKVGISGSPTIVANVVNMVSERPPVMLSVGHSESALIDSLVANMKTGGNVLDKRQAMRKRKRKPPRISPS